METDAPNPDSITPKLFRKIVEQIKDYQENAGKTVTDELLASAKTAKEMFVCSACYKVFPQMELLNQHFSEVSIDKPKQMNFQLFKKNNV